MSIPFTAEQFFNVFAAYNGAIWPAQILAYLLAAAALALSVSQRRSAGRLVAGILALFWAWMGTVYHLLYFSAVNPAAFLFGVLFIVQGLLFLVVGGIRGRLSFRFTRRLIPLVGAALIFYAMVVYPLLGAAFGHDYPSSPTFGVTPCSTTIFTLGLLLWAAPIPIYLLIIPVLWAIVGTSAAIQLGVPQDYGLPIAAIVTVSLVVIANRTGKKSAPRAV